MTMNYVDALVASLAVSRRDPDLDHLIDLLGTIEQAFDRVRSATALELVDQVAVILAEFTRIVEAKQLYDALMGGGEDA